MNTSAPTRTSPAGLALRWVSIAIALLILLVALYTWATLSWSYADGERAGYVLKLSKKGWLCKTWEGEMQMVAIPGAVPEKFAFTVRDEAVVAKVNAELGKLVTLSYEQHKGVPTTCFGDTMYYAKGVEVVPQQGK
ncbi:hypothetical protein [Niveibacterium sp. SC-1]|uniref:hypothetical protein n=1 Tax=Niveibacterium sp. SC-1 TaxID=3135646 RepID=UPI00311E9FFE